MNLKSPHSKQNRAVALVITLLFLSIITFLAIAFLAMSSRDKSAVNASLDVSTSRSMSESALARAQAEIIAKMMATNDILNYDYMASHNYVSPNPFNATEGTNDPLNVNYDSFFTNAGAYNVDEWAQNINNLFYDPRAPVFVVTNSSGSNDFRFWVDINRNGRFETNGPVATIDPTGAVVPNLTSLENGEPEWIGVLKYPETNHSVINPFIGRYAFMVLPIGKTLDFNFIHNIAKFAATPGNDTSSPPSPNMQSDGYIRDEGVGSWELNLAALITQVSPMFQTNSLFGNYPGSYRYIPNFAVISPNTGVDYDASQFVAFRYGFNPYFPQALGISIGNPTFPTPLLYNIDIYGNSPSTTYPFDYSGNPPNLAWPGTYSSNMFYDIQDLFDSTKTGTNFPRTLSLAVGQIDTMNRYAFQRLIDSIGMGSSPEYGVYVYSNLFVPYFTNFNGPIPPPTLLRTKVNINYDNTPQIQAGPYGPNGAYTPMPTNLTAWSSPTAFFTNAADLLLRSQVYTFTNYATNSAGQLYVPYGTASNFLLGTFGITNIPVYAATNPGLVYTDQIHRMLQLAANIYAAANPTFLGSGVNRVQQPPVFRPLFNLVHGGTSQAMLYISGYANVTGTAAYNQLILTNWRNSSDALLGPTAIGTNDNVWGVPWIVGAVKGIPAFNQFTYNNQVYFDRKLLFTRKTAGNGYADTNDPPFFTNQFYEMAISNVCGMDIWNPYTNAFYGSNPSRIVVAIASNLMTVTVTNNYNWGTNINITNYQIATNLTLNAPWFGGTVVNNLLKTLPGEFKTLMQSTNVALPPGYFSDTLGQFVIYTNSNNYQVLPQDTNQTGFPTHNWVVSVTNRLYYALFDGQANSGNVLDFVNIGPFGSVFPLTQYLQGVSNVWTVTPATDSINSPPSQGVLNQIGASLQGIPGKYYYSLRPNGQPDFDGTVGSFGPPNPNQSSQANTPYGPSACYDDTNGWAASDPLVHYTIGDLTYPNYTSQLVPGNLSFIPITIGGMTKRYQTGVANTQWIFSDPGMTTSDNWQFPTNLFPGIGWLGRIHRGTPWQTVFLKADNPSQGVYWNSTAPNNPPWVSSPYTYPTNDWSILDLFTAVPNDNAARGLISVNQANDAAWAAVFAGVIALTNGVGGIPISPTNDSYNFYGLAVDGPAGINATRATNRNGLFHHIGDILQSAPLTVSSPYIANAGSLNDEIVERIPQQTLSLMKVGLPQFVIYGWGQSLKPKSLYSGNNPNLVDICTNYEITGEYLTRTVCHVVSSDGTPAAPKIVVDSFNIEPGN